MKILMNLMFVMTLASIQAQDFKPYKLESGKLVYENIRYKTRAVFKLENGVETSSSERIPYVAEQVNYYWDQFGDVAFEEVYQVSKFGGELLPKKVKISEQLWIDEHRYYFKIQENKVSDDPYYLRIKCKENFQYYQIKDSWVETLHMGTERTGTIKIIERQADYYKINKFQDLYTWKGLVLKNENFVTTPKGKRLYPDRSRTATEIDTSFVIKSELFNPIWLKREKLYKTLNEDKIVELIDTRPDVMEQADNIYGIELQKNDILLFVTSKLTIGKMQVIAIDSNNQLIIKYSLYRDNDVIDWRDSFKIKNNSIVNIDTPHVENIEHKELDFKWSFIKKGILFPQNNISVLLLKPSRTKTLKIKEYFRKIK